MCLQVLVRAIKDCELLCFQGKEEFEKNQKQLLEKGSIIRQKTALEQQQVGELLHVQQRHRVANLSPTGCRPSWKRLQSVASQQVVERSLRLVSCA